jgi:hypothetical protein
MPDVPKHMPQHDVPNVVLKRLQRQSPAPADWHPDADLLTAFTERSLTDREREHVMNHLGRCGDCREVLAIALPAFEADTTPVTIAAPPRGWLNWPALRWGVVAAGLALVTSVGVLQYLHHNENPKMAAKLALQNEAPATQNSPSSSQPAPPQANSAPPEMRMKMDLRMKVPPNAAASVPAEQSPSSDAFFAQRAVRARPGGSAGGIIGGTVNSESAQASTAAASESRHGFANSPGAGAALPPTTAKQNAAIAPQRLDAPPSSSQVVEVQAESAQASKPQPGQPQDNLAQGENAQQSQARALDSFNVVARAKDPVPARASSPSAPVSAPPAIPLQTSPALMLHASPRWNITPAGVLQRSLDAGKTGEDITVNSASANDASQVRTASGAAAAYADKKLQKERMQMPTVAFRAVAAIGPEVWVGGSPSALYHSVDSGAHWTQVLPSSAGAPLTGDITLIEFLDPQHGTITTTSRELWITADTGQTWRKQ